MPIFQRDGEKLFFVHVPKCGGTSVKEILYQNGWKQLPPEIGGGNHTPRHLWEQLPEAVSCDFKFTLVRDPLRRFTSHCSMWLDNLTDQRLEKIYAIFEKEVAYPPKELILDHTHSLLDRLGENINQYDDVMFKDKETFLSIWNNIHDELNKLGKDSVRYCLVNNTFLHEFKKPADQTSFDEVAMHFLQETYHKVNTIGGNMTPIRFYLSPDVEVYKLEEHNLLLDRLLEKNIITHTSHCRGLPQMNKNISCQKFLGAKNISLSNLSPETKTMFLFFYGRDYQLLGYEEK
jgi:hypothetical protein